jgi:CRISPR-associated protein Csb1
MPQPLDLATLKEAVAGTATAFRCVTELQPAGGEGDKVFPPTYEGGKYAFEARLVPGREEAVPCVLLDSVQSQANRMELALLEAWRAGMLPLPVVSAAFPAETLEKPLRVTSLEAPHRIADALLRDSLLDGLPFRKSDVGRCIGEVETFNAAALFEHCPTALVFGMWDSTGPKGGLGAKFARAVVSEIVGIDVAPGRRTSSRIDPAQILLQAGPLYQAASGDAGIGWTLDGEKARKDSKGKAQTLGKTGRPSEANHGNVTPTIADGGVTLRKALQTTVLSLPTLRRLRFPQDGRYEPAADRAARTALAALALCAAALTREQGCDLRSRCLLVASSPVEWELLDRPGEPPARFTLPAADAIALYRGALDEARAAGLPFHEEELVLQPSDELVALVRKSQELATEQGSEVAEA